MASVQLSGSPLLHSYIATFRHAKQTQVAFDRRRSSGGGRSATRRCAYTDQKDLRLDLDENPEGIISGEWPENFSLLSYEDLFAYLQSQIFADDHKIKPSTVLEELMSTPILTASGNQTLAEIEHHFKLVSGLPVVDDDFRCIGMVSKKDIARANHMLESKVSEVMSSPAIILSHEKTAMDAAALMLKMKIHRIPIVNEKRQVIGIVTRTDIFEALESLEM